MKSEKSGGGVRDVRVPVAWERNDGHGRRDSRLERVRVSWERGVLRVVYKKDKCGLGEEQVWPESGKCCLVGRGMKVAGVSYLAKQLVTVGGTF